MPVPSIPDKLISALSDARTVAVLTGAGVSAESGVPTFRSPGGLWENLKPEDLATPQAFAANPQRVWDWYMYRRELMAKSRPNPGHYALALWERHFPRFGLVTQNVDGLHTQAGSTELYELHGNILRSRCHDCMIAAGEIGLDTEGNIPYCSCGGAIRPDVVWFGEMLPHKVAEDAWNVVRQAEVFFSVGTSSVVYPAAGLIDLARSRGAFLIEVNPEETEQSGLFDVVLRAPSGIALPAISEELGIAVN